MKRLPAFADFGHVPQRALILLAAVLISPMALVATTSMLGTRPSESASQSAAERVASEGRRVSGVVTGSGNAAAPESRALTLVRPTTAAVAADASVAAAEQAAVGWAALPSSAMRSAVIAGAALTGLLVGIALARTDPRQA